MARGNARMRIFLDDQDYRQFIYLLGEAMEEFAVPCWNYCLMPNHYHLTLQPTLPNISLAIQRLNGTYAQWWNRKHQRVGHVFQGRFKAQIVQREGYLLTLSRYVVANPVRASLVDAAQEWPWSSYRATVGLVASPSFLACESTLGLFGNDTDATLRDRYAEFVASGTDDPTIIDRIRSNEQILGSRAFKDQLLGNAAPELRAAS
jgi:putative transposase